MVSNVMPSSGMADPAHHPSVANDDSPLEVDEWATDSAYAESIRSSTLASLTSEITQGLYENGRRYHSYGDGYYGFPNDEREADRLDMQHAMMTLLVGNRLYWAPIDKNPKQVLDLGTGTGIWAIDFGELHPSAEVIGTDLSPIQPEWVPPNVIFEIDDAEREWTFKENYFDFIHNRNFVCSIKDWPKLVKQCYTHLRPGGWMEFKEKYPYMQSDDNTLAEDSALCRWGRFLFDAGDVMGVSPSAPRSIKKWMEEAGFINVEEHVLKIPVSPWAKDKTLKHIGAFEHVNMTEGLENLSLRPFTMALKWSPEQTQLFLMEVRKDIKNRKIHAYYNFFIVFGQKPDAPA